MDTIVDTTRPAPLRMPWLTEEEVAGHVGCVPAAWLPTVEGIPEYGPIGVGSGGEGRLDRVDVALGVFGPPDEECRTPGMSLRAVGRPEPGVAWGAHLYGEGGDVERVGSGTEPDVRAALEAGVAAIRRAVLMRTEPAPSCLAGPTLEASGAFVVKVYSGTVRDGDDRVRGSRLSVSLSAEGVVVRVGEEPPVRSVSPELVRHYRALAQAVERDFERQSWEYAVAQAVASGRPAGDRSHGPAPDVTTASAAD